MGVICQILSFWAYYLALTIILGLIGIAIKITWIPAGITGLLTIFSAIAQIFRLCNYCS